MATVIHQRDKSSLDNAHIFVADLIEKFGLEWTFQADHPLPDTSKRLQIRDESHYAPAAKVAELRAALKREDAVPAIVISKDGRLLDGNTRVTAAERNGFPTLPAFIVQTDYDTGTKQQQNRMWLFGAAANTGQSKGLDRKELAHAVKMIGADPNYTATRIAALLRVTESVVRSILNEDRARTRAEGLGVSVNGSLSRSQLRALGSSSEVFHDEPFDAMFRLVQESGMKPSEISDLARRVKSEKSDTDAMNVISAERAARRDQIAEYTASGRSVPPNAAKLRQRLGFINSFYGDAHSLMEHNPKLVPQYLNEINRAIETLTSVRDAHAKAADA